MLMLTTQRNLSEKIREAPTSIPVEMTIENVLTTGTLDAPTTATIEKVGTGNADNRDDFRGKRPRDNDHEVNTVKRPNGRRDYQEDYNKTLKGPCQLYPKSNHTTEECRVLKSIYTQRATKGDSAKRNRKQDRNEDVDDDQDRNPRHQYVSPTDVVHSIFGGKVSIEESS